MTQTEMLPEQDRAPTERKKPEVLVRLASALVLAALALGATLYSPWTFLLLVAVGGMIVAWEWGRLTRGSGFDGTALIEAVTIAAVTILVALGRPDLALLVFLAASVAVVVVRQSTSDPRWAAAGLTYAAFPAAALVWLRSDPALGLMAVLYLFAVAWTTDSASFAAGRLIGGPKLAPRISPRKTWSGFIIGALVPALIGYAFAIAVPGTSAWRLALVSVVLALSCQMGDLVESAVKRRFGAKDVSQLIPGHGGLLDRIDGLLFAAVFAALLALLRNPAEPGRALLIW